MASAARFNLDNFKAEVLGRGLARTNRFEVFINKPLGFSSAGSAEDVSLLCEISNFPPLTLNVRPLKIFGPTFQRPHTSEYGGEGMSMTFHVDREMKVKRFFDDWIQFIVNYNDWTVSYPEDYLTTVNIRQLDEENNVTYEIELREAFPRSMTLMDLNMSTQSQTHRLNIIFAYRYWKRVEEKQEIPIVPQTIVPDVTFLDLPTRRGVSWDLGNDLGGQVDGGSDFAVSA